MSYRHSMSRIAAIVGFAAMGSIVMMFMGAATGTH
jgi:hypothetical protein